MYSGDTALHGATWESARRFLTDQDEVREPLRLRRENFGGSFAIERAFDQTPVGMIRWERRRLLPKPAPLRIVLDTSLELPETFEVLLLWIVVQDDLRNSG